MVPSTKKFRTEFHNLMRNHNPYVVALLEIKVSFVSMGNFFESFNRLASKIVDPVGRVGRIWPVEPK